MNHELLQELTCITPEEQQLLCGNPVDMVNYASGKSFIVDKDRLLEKGKLITIRPHTRFADFPLHTHNYIEIIYMCSGSTTHIVNDDTVICLQAGELLFLNQHASHAIQRAEKQDVAVNFIVLPQFFDTAFNMIGFDNPLSRFLLGSLQKQTEEISCLHFRVSEVLPIQNLIENMVWSIVNHQPNNRRINQATMGLLLLQLLNYTQYLEVPIVKGYNNALVVETLREIEENYKTASLSEVAARHGISSAYLSRLIKETTGNTYKELLQSKRLSKAAQLLRETHITIGDIIAAVGYDNTSYFYRIFGEKYGVQPKEYRRM